MTHTKLRIKGISDTATIKQDIQDALRAHVIKRDKGCILRNIYGIPKCNGYRTDGELILQADHLVTRSNSATYGDTRLVVCVCKGHHGWKKWHEREYNALLKEKVLDKEIVKLWERCERESWRLRKYTTDWKLALLAIQKETEKLSTPKFD